MNIGLLMDPHQICYNTLNYFIDCIANALNHLGIHTEKFLELDDLQGTSWDALVTINDNFSSLKTDNGSFIADSFKCPVFLIIVDPPYYHHHLLESHMNNMHLILLDEGHVEYCRKYYPTFKSTKMSYLLGPTGKAKSYEERTIDVLFTGSLPKDDYKSIAVKACPYEWAGSLFDALVLNGITHPEITTYQSMLTLLPQEHARFSSRDFKLLMSVFGTYSEYYLRRYFRQKLITTLVDAGIKVHVAGNGWENLYCSCPDNLILEGSVDFLKTADLASDARISLNVMPWFKDGLHDRILTTMLNGSVCVTDPSSCIKSNFEDGRNIVLYDLLHLKELPDKITWLLENPDKAKSIALEGQHKASNKYSWNNFVLEYILEPLLTQ